MYIYIIKRDSSFVAQRFTVPGDSVALTIEIESDLRNEGWIHRFAKRWHDGNGWITVRETLPVDLSFALFHLLYTPRESVPVECVSTEITNDGLLAVSDCGRHHWMAELYLAGYDNVMTQGAEAIAAKTGCDPDDVENLGRLRNGLNGCEYLTVHRHEGTRYVVECGHDHETGPYTIVQELSEFNAANIVANLA